jgi:NhaP-type Na+/H+ or K+/H+ antiporter
VNLGFSESLLLLGALLAGAAALSGWLRASVLSISVLAVAAGIAAAAFDVVSVDPESTLVKHIVELALIVTLFADGLLVERELLARHWGPAARALVLAMPLTLLLLAVFALLVFDSLTVAECFLLAAVLSPTDPVVTSTVVTAKRVPALVRHTLNLESGRFATSL